MPPQPKTPSPLPTAMDEKIAADQELKQEKKKKKKKKEAAAEKTEEPQEKAAEEKEEEAKQEKKKKKKKKTEDKEKEEVKDEQQPDKEEAAPEEEPKEEKKKKKKKSKEKAQDDEDAKDKDSLKEGNTASDENGTHKDAEPGNKDDTESIPSESDITASSKSLPPVQRTRGNTPRSSQTSSPAASIVGRGSIWSLASDRRSIARGDINYVFAEPLDKKYECPICCQVLRYPVQFEDCGHRCCSSCLPELLRVAPRCPVDQSRVERDKILVDKAFQKELDNLAVKCSYAEKGCKWAEKLSELITHLDACDFGVVPCPKGCDAEFERRFLLKHKREDCPKRGVFCEFCNLEMSVEEEVVHLQTCELFPMHCPNGCKAKNIPRNEIKQHMAKDCQKQKIDCPFVDAGCEFKASRKDMDKHLKEDPESHLSMIGATITDYKATLEAHAKVIDTHTDRLVDVESKVESLEKLYGSQLVWKIDNYSEKLQESKSGKKSTIYSPPFLTNRHGYKLALSACLYGDGKSRGKHMSLFCCICKGEYDALLIWPFSHRTTFTLVDQCQDPAARRNVTYTIKPNTCKENRPFLGRPTGERNASFGAQKFVELAVMDTLDYIRDDTIYIKVNIDSENMQIV